MWSESGEWTEGEARLNCYGRDAGRQECLENASDSKAMCLLTTGLKGKRKTNLRLFLPLELLN